MLVSKALQRSWLAASSAPRSHKSSVARHALREETPEQKRERQLRESARVEERVIYIRDADHFHREMQAAGSNLVIVEAQQEGVCMTGLDEEPELHWRGDREAALRPCQNIKHTLERTARECQDVVFLSLQADDDAACPVAELCDDLGIEVLPTIQFWRNGAKLWEHKGILNMDQDLGEGVLFFNGSGGNGLQVSDHITELSSEEDIGKFVANQPEGVLTVVDISLSDAAPCIRVFPAVVALARSFKGFAAFGRVVADQLPGGREAGRRILQDHNVVEVPTFLFFKDGREVERHVGSSRGDLMGKIMEVQARYGVAPPPPPPGAAQQRRTIQRRVTRRARAG